MARPSVDLGQVEIRSISPSDEIATFTCGTDDSDRDLNDYLHSDALRSHALDTVHVYVAVVDGRVVGYAAVLTDVVRLTTPDKKKLGMTHLDHPGVPALKVGRLAVATDFRESYRGLGTALMGFCYSVAVVIAQRAGCRLITVDAAPKSVSFYEGLGFVKNKLQPKKGETQPDHQEGDCTSMRFDINTDPLPGWCLFE